MGQYILYNRLGSSRFVVETALTLAQIPLVYEPLATTPDTDVAPVVAHLNPWGLTLF